MKKLFSTNHSLKNFDLVILLGRVAIASLMLVHGLPKLAMILSGEPIQFPGVLGMSPAFSLALTVFAEVFCSLLILVGFGTRIATIPLIITMLVAAFYILAAAPFAKQELAIHYLLAYVLLLITGSGRYSLDYLLQRKPVMKPAYAEVKNR
jgi:putative oxidoreductase